MYDNNITLNSGCFMGYKNTLQKYYNKYPKDLAHDVDDQYLLNQTFNKYKNLFNYKIDFDERIFYIDRSTLHESETDIPRKVKINDIFDTKTNKLVFKNKNYL